MRLWDYAKTLLGISAFAPAPPAAGPSLESVDSAREAIGGNLIPLPQTRLRWYLRDLESAQASADSGHLTPAAQLYRAMRRDGTISGLLSTRAGGLVALPKRFSGNAEAIEMLQSDNGTRSMFDEMFPPSELKLLAQDGVMLGVGVAELVPVEGRPHPVMIRLEPEFLQYRWIENRWYYRSSVGLLPITPGDGRWMLHLPGGRMSPWQFGAWIACGGAWINKAHAQLHRANFGGKLANPARVMHAPLGATEPERVGMLARLAAWGVNTVIELPVGWEASLLESNSGNSYKVWAQDEDSSNLDFKMSLAGQVVTSEGGTGFVNGDLFKSIRADLIQTDGDELAFTINTQGLPVFSMLVLGDTELKKLAAVKWETETPQDLQRTATTLTTVAQAVTQLNDAMRPYHKQIDPQLLTVRFNLPLMDLPTDSSASAQKLDLAPADIAKVVRASEARASRGLPPFGDERDDKTIPELEAAAAPAPLDGFGVPANDAIAAE